MDTLDTFQYNDWDDTRIVLLILAITWCLLHDVGEDAVTFLDDLLIPIVRAAHK